MNDWQAGVLFVAGAYLAGSIPFGYWAGKLKGIDIRQHGSGNIGATNVIRVLGKGIGIPVFILDMLKGFLPTLLAQQDLPAFGASTELATLIAVCCAAASVLGHNFTPWLGFKGGKGVATSAGALLGLAPWALLAGMVMWLLVFKVSRYVALASIMAAIFIPLTMAIMMASAHQWNGILLGLGVALCLMVIIRHRSNISRLMAGTENRFEPKKKPNA